MIRVYIAAPFEERFEVQEIRKHLRTTGIIVDAPWLDVPEKDHEEISIQMRRQRVQEDLDAVERCHIFIAFNPPGWGHKGTGGRHVELGYALAFHKPIILIGNKTNLFHWAGCIQSSTKGTLATDIVGLAFEKRIVAVPVSER